MMVPEIKNQIFVYGGIQLDAILNQGGRLNFPKVHWVFGFSEFLSNTGYEANSDR